MSVGAGADVGEGRRGLETRQAQRYTVLRSTLLLPFCSKVGHSQWALRRLGKGK